jgi:hypothetical protein
LWVHVLSLEAPIVAVLWQAALAKAHGVTLMPMLHVGLGLAVWTIYALDRTWDTFHDRDPWHDRRHAFYRRHRWKLLLLIIPAAAVVLVWMALREIPEGIFWQAVSISVLTGLYFLIYLMRLVPALMPKPHAAALLFALGCTTSVRFFSMPETWAEPVTECAILALLVLSNLSGIAAREEELRGQSWRWRRAHPTMLFGNIAIVLLLIFYIQKGSFDAVMLAPATAVLVGLALLALLHRVRTHTSEDAYRILADLAVIAPLPLIWVMAR